MPDLSSGSPFKDKPYLQPTDMKVEKTPEGVVISRRWTFKPDDLFIGGIGLVLLIFELGNLIYGTTGSLGILEYVFIFFGPMMFYFSLAHRFNSTRFTVGMGKITVRKGPLPWFGSQVLPTAEVEKVILKGEKHQARRNTWTLFRVVASLRNGKEAVLETCEKEEQAGFLHQELVRSLGL